MDKKRKGRRGEEEEMHGNQWEGGGGEKRSWSDPKMHSPYFDGQPVHPYQAGAAHTHHAPYVLPPSVGYLHSVKISAYHTNVPKERGGDKGEQREKRRMWVGRKCEGEGEEEKREGGEERGWGRRDTEMHPPKCTHLIQMVNLCTLIKQELHTPIMPPK